MLIKIKLALEMSEYHQNDYSLYLEKMNDIIAKCWIVVKTFRWTRV